MESEWFNKLPTNTIKEGVLKTYNYLSKYHRISLSISGGADSDDMLDIVQHIIPFISEEWKQNSNIYYVFFDTGIEMKATKSHLEYLKDKYNIDFI